MGSQQGTYSSRQRRSAASGQVSHTIILGRQWTLTQTSQVWRPPTDVFETNESVVVKLEIAGMSEDDFSITFADRTLNVSGVRCDPSAKVGYHQMEISYGEFHAEINVSLPIDVDKIEASYQNGFLLVTLPKDHRRFSNADER